MVTSIDQQFADKLYQIYKACQGRVIFYPWVQDANLNGGAADLTRSGGTGVQNHATPDSTTGWRVRDDLGDPRLMCWFATCEDAAGVTKTISLRGSKETRRWRASRKLDLADVMFEDYSKYGGIPLVKGEDLYATGGANQTNAACQHAVVAVVYYPGLSPVKITEGPFLDIVQQNASITPGTADTLDYPGDTVISTFEDSEKDLPNDGDSLYALVELCNGPGLVDASIIAVRHPTMNDREYIIPTSRAVDYTDQWVKGPGWIFSGISAPKIGAHGHTAGAQIYGLRLGVIQ